MQVLPGILEGVLVHILERVPLTERMGNLQLLTSAAKLEGCSCCSHPGSNHQHRAERHDSC
jgi:hypothetical protein